MKKIALSLLAVMIQTICVAQTVVKGNVVNERGESIEYVSIGFEDDSVGVISDVKGHFELTIPAGRKHELSFSHVSYLTTEIPYEQYAKGEPLTIVLKERVIELTEVVIGKKNKPKTIVGKGLPAPGLVGTSGHGSDLGPEGGITFSCSKSYVISDIHGALPQPLRDQRRGEGAAADAGHAGIALPVGIGDARGRRQPHRALVQRHVSAQSPGGRRRVNRALAGEEHQHDLLHSVLICMSGQKKFHNIGIISCP